MAHSEDSERPNVTLDEISVVLLDLYGIETQKCIVKEFVSHRDRNFYIEDNSSGNKFVLKIWSSINPEEELVFRSKLMDYVNAKGFACPVSVLNKHGNFLAQLQTGSNKCYPVGLLVYVPGTCISKLNPIDASTWHDVGRLLGSLHTSLEDFTAEKLPLPEDDVWFMENMHLVPEYAQKLMAVSKKRTAADYSLTQSFADMFKSTVVPQFGKFTKGYIHHDFHENNIILLPNIDVSEKRNPKEKFGILDFGDVLYSYIVFDLAILMAYSMTAYDTVNLECVEMAGHALAGYLMERSLNDAELAALYVCTCCRILQDTVGCEYDASLQSESNAYLVQGIETGWQCLHLVHSMGKAAFHATIMAVLKKYNISVVLPM